MNEKQKQHIGVQMDAEHAAQIKRIATDQKTTMSKLIRAWIIERLRGMLP
jgi:hypothetical protein